MESKKVSTFAPAKQETDAPVAQLVEHLTLNAGVLILRRDKLYLSLFLFYITKIIKNPWMFQIIVLSLQPDVLQLNYRVWQQRRLESPLRSDLGLTS